jgi:hypothetical protein
MLRIIPNAPPAPAPSPGPARADLWSQLVCEWGVGGEERGDTNND